MIDDIFQGEIFVQSRCILREQVVKNFLLDIVDHYGFTVVDYEFRRVTKKGSHTVIICLIDDFNVCGDIINLPTMYRFDKNTIVLTDNHILFKPAYTVLKLPTSFYSTFLYSPKLNHWVPERDFHFSINRGDEQRLHLFKKFQNKRGLTDLDFINYNAAHSNHEPYRNHQHYLEEACIQSYLNLVIETYAGDKTITFSEKTFRALQTPAPWMLYACTESVAYLRTLGFDVLDDIVDHSYDSDKHNDLKADKWFDYGLVNLEKIKSLDVEHVRQRCNQAAAHNQQLLQQWKRCWPVDFSNWLSNLVQVLSKTV